MTTQLLSRREDKRMYSMRADSRRSSLKALFVAQVTGVCGGGGGAAQYKLSTGNTWGQALQRSAVIQRGSMRLDAED